MVKKIKLEHDKDDDDDSNKVFPAFVKGYEE